MYFMLPVFVLIVFVHMLLLRVPTHFKHLHDKHKALFALDVDKSCKNFVASMKSMHSNRMFALLIDVEAAIAEEDGPDVVFCTEQDGGCEEHNTAGGDEANEEDSENVEKDDDDESTKDVETKEDNQITEKGAQLEAQSAVADVPQPAELLESSTGADVGDKIPVNSPDRSDFVVSFRSPRKNISDAAWNAAPDAPSMDLFAPGSDKYVWLHETPSGECFCSLVVLFSLLFHVFLSNILFCFHVFCLLQPSRSPHQL
jgi:hypothetical protein